MAISFADKDSCNISNTVLPVVQKFLYSVLFFFLREREECIEPVLRQY